MKHISRVIHQPHTRFIIFAFIFQIQSVISRSFSRSTSNPSGLGKNLDLLSPVPEIVEEEGEKDQSHDPSHGRSQCIHY